MRMGDNSMKLGKDFSKSQDYSGEFIAEGSGWAKYFTSFQKKKKKKKDIYVVLINVYHSHQWQYIWGGVTWESYVSWTIQRLREENILVEDADLFLKLLMLGRDCSEGCPKGVQVTLKCNWA